MSRFNLIIFDMDGVLTDSSPGHARAYHDLWRLIGIEGPAYDSIRGRPTGDVIIEQTAGRKPSPEQVAEWTRFKQDQARHYLRDELVTFPDTLSSLQALKSAGIGMAVGTSASRRTAEQLLSQSGILALLPVLVTCDDVKRGKPAPDTYLLAMQLAGASSEETLVVEDSVAGLRAAAAASAWSSAVRAHCQFSDPRFLGNYPDLQALLMAIFVPIP